MGLGVLLAGTGARLLVVPDRLRRAGLIEEDQVGWNVSVGRERALEETGDRCAG